jgi:pimeloyl-ACP methyl ester carboxylesterase
VAWDPRGTGASSPVDCVDDLDPYFDLDPSPDTAAERQALIDAAHKWDDECEQKDGKFLPYISTQDTAKDMHSIRQALGGDKVSYFGFSYGSELGATYATMFPDDIRAMVIDGASDPNSGFEADSRQSTIGIERAFDKALDACSADRKCPFGNGDAGAAFDKLWAKIDANPVPVSADGRPPVGQGVALYGVISTLYDEGSWPALYHALASLQAGDGDPMLDLYDQYLERNPDGTWTNAFEGLIAINCLDDPGPTDPAQISASQDLGVLARVSRVERELRGVLAGYRKPPITSRAGAGPSWSSARGDPVTPIESAQHGGALEQGVLVTVKTNQHGIPVQRLHQRRGRRLPGEPESPAANTTCRAISATGRGAPGHGASVAKIARAQRRDRTAEAGVEPGGRPAAAASFASRWSSSLTGASRPCSRAISTTSPFR